MVEPNRTEAIVEFDYVAQESDELSLQKGDVITDIRTQPGGWWEGSLGTKRGMFPDNFVRVLSESDNIKDSLANDVTLRPASGRRCKVLYSYQPVNEDELPLQVNDVIDIIAEVEEGWWKGRLKDANKVHCAALHGENLLRLRYQKNLEVWLPNDEKNRPGSQLHSAQHGALQ